MTTWSAVTWDTARAGGFAAYILLSVAVSIGLVLRNRWQTPKWPRLITNELHGYLSLLALVFIVVHVLSVWPRCSFLSYRTIGRCGWDSGLSPSTSCSPSG